MMPSSVKTQWRLRKSKSGAVMKIKIRVAALALWFALFGSLACQPNSAQAATFAEGCKSERGVLHWNPDHTRMCCYRRNRITLKELALWCYGP
jgi:hypothetical protein